MQKQGPLRLPRGGPSSTTGSTILNYIATDKCLQMNEIQSSVAPVAPVAPVVAPW